MNKELLIAGILLSISTVLKICSVVALCQIPLHLHEHEHEQHEIVHESKKKAQKTERLLRFN